MLIKKLIFIFAFLLLFIFLQAIILGIHWGVFSAVNISISHLNRNYFITMKHPTNYLNFQNQIDSVKNYLSLNEIIPGSSATLIWDDPIYSTLNKLRVSGGFFHNDSFLLGDSIFRTIILDSGNVILGSLTAHPQIAPYKLYPEILEWLNNSSYRRDSSRVIIQSLNNKGEIIVYYPIHSTSHISDNSTQ